MSTISTSELCERANVTFRQVDHWVRKGRLEPLSGGGSGNHRTFDANEAVGRAAAIGRVSRALGKNWAGGAHGASDYVLDLVAAHWERGWLDLGEGVLLTW